MSKQTELYIVYYFVGGWMNFKRQLVSGRFTEEQANDEIVSLNKMGYAAFKMKENQFKTIGPIDDNTVYDNDANTEKLKKAAWESIQQYGYRK